MTEKKTEALKLIDLLVKQDILTKHETNLLREALAEQPAPQQEPVAWIDICEKGQMSGLRYWSEPDNRHEVPLYTSPPAQQQEPVAVIRSVVHSGDGGVRVTWLGGFPQIGDLLYTSQPASKPHEQQEPVACKTLCELCVKRGYHFCANAAQTTPIPSPPASKPLTDEEILAANYPDGEENGPTIAAPNFELICFARQIEAKLKEKNT